MIQSAKKPKPVRWTSIPKVGSVYIMGHRGQGKSALAWYIADTYRKQAGYPNGVAAYSFPPEATKALPKWIVHVDSPSALSTLKRPHIVVIDESQQGIQKAFSFVSTIGLYDANEELLAVAKLSEPLKKAPSNEITLRCRLDY